MKTLLFMWISFLAVPALAQESREPFAPSNRIVTVEQSFSGTGGHWTTWAVLPDRIVVYRQGSQFPAELAGEVKITPEQERNLRETVAKIPAASKGRIWSTPDVQDGVSLSIHFTQDGSQRDDDIELENLWRPEFRDLCTSISSLLPSNQKITFEDILLKRPYQERLTVVSQSIKAYRTALMPKKAPWWKFWK